MKNAPNLKHQPKDKYTEVYIFAGADAYAHAKGWEEGYGKQIAEDTTPPIYLGPRQLADLANLRIIDEGRRCVSVHRAGDIDQTAISVIATKLAMANVQYGRLTKGIPGLEIEEEWTEETLIRLREEAERGESVVVQLPVQHKQEGVTPALNQMGPSQRGDVLAAHYDNHLAIDGDSDTVHHYNGVVWQPVQDKELQRVMARIFIDAEIAYSPASVKNAVDAMKLSLPQMGTPARHLIGFRNGVFLTPAPHNSGRMIKMTGCLSPVMLISASRRTAKAWKPTHLTSGAGYNMRRRKTPGKRIDFWPRCLWCWPTATTGNCSLKSPGRVAAVKV